MKKYVTLLSFFLFFGFLPPKIAIAAPSITNITDNKNSYTNAQVPKYKKYEITFNINNTVATNLFYPYDPSNIPGITPSGTGITVNAEFLEPGNSDWSKSYITPAFYYQDFDYAVKNNSDWYFANGNFAWKIRFAPNKTGTWQYRITATDGSGTTTSGVQSFVVTDSASHGFVRVSPTDPRYFEFDDKTFFNGLGYNIHDRTIDWINPTLSAKSLFPTLKSKGVQLVRMWQSGWSIYGSYWNPWRYVGSDLRFTYLRHDEKYPGSDFSMGIARGISGLATNNCMSYGGWEDYTPAIKPSTTYRIQARVKLQNMGTAINSSKPYGLLFKTAYWLDNCGDSGTGTPQSNYFHDNSDWTTITGTYQSGSNDYFLPYLYIALENIDKGQVNVDYVSLQEVLPNGQFGTNLIPKPSMDHLKYIDQRNAYGFDKMLEIAEQNDVYLKVVTLEKEDVQANLTNFDGTVGSNSANPGTTEQSVGNFYGNYGAPTKVYWLQQAWWRYEQARWGYSTSIHSWELLNEGNPGDGNHWKLTDEMGKFFKCRAFGITVSTADNVACSSSHPNKHMTTTSFWDTFSTGFWGNPKWPNSDFADVHAYISTSKLPTADLNQMKYDAAYYHQGHSKKYQETVPKPMPIVRGEAGLDDIGCQCTDILSLNKDTGKVWLHNYTWSQLEPGGLYEEYWWWQEHMVGNNQVDPNNEMKKLSAFYANIPLSNGKYSDAKAAVGNSQLRAWGQKDITNKRAHLWIQNSKHEWKNVVDGVNITPITTTVNVPGFAATTALKVEWWDTYTGAISKTETLTTNNQGELVLNVSNLSTDIAVKIGDYSNSTSPSSTPVVVPGDTDGDGHVNIYDYNNLMKDFGTTAARSNFNQIGTVDIYDYNILITNFGK